MINFFFWGCLDPGRKDMHGSLSPYVCGDDVYLKYLNAEDQYDNAEKAHGDFATSKYLHAKQWKLQQEAQCS